MRLVMGILLSFALGLLAYAALAGAYDSRASLAQADAAQGDQARLLRAEADAISVLTKRVAALEQRVEALEAKSKSATSAVPRTGPRGWIVY